MKYRLNQKITYIKQMMIWEYLIILESANEHLNNNLILDNHYFKIVRINGDESIRLIYNGTCTSEDCLEISNEITSPFNLYNEMDT